MTRPGFRGITFEVPDDFFNEIIKYSKESGENLSVICRRAIRREINYNAEFEVLRECEKLIDLKLNQYQVVPITAKKINTCNRKKK